MKLVPLPEVPSGSRAELAEISGDASVTQRLNDLGLKVGAPLEVVRQGSPCIIRFSGTQLCFRATDATRLWVRLPATI